LDSVGKTSKQQTRAPVVAIVGPGAGATARECETATELGELAAREGWILVTGGRPAGVMQAAMRGAKSVGGFSLGIIPSSDARDAAPECDAVVASGLGEARNVLVALSSDVVIACGMNAGTASEVSFALAAHRGVVLIAPDPHVSEFFQRIGGPLVSIAANAAEAVSLARAQMERA
jgi:uncharacterized protein (TIGR00725 family)